MKIPVVFLGLALLSGGLLAETTVVPTTPTPAPAKPAKPVPGPVKPAPKKDDVMGTVKGIEIARPNGTFLGLEVVDGNFKLTFYNNKRKPTAVDVTRASARWPNKRSGTPSEYRCVLNGSGTALVGNKPVLPPLVFNVILTLLRGEGENPEVVETYVVPFRA